MSFSNNCKSDKIPGPIRGNGGLNGICERVCIQCDKVLDMCMRQETLTDLSVTLTDIEPSAGLTAPYNVCQCKRNKFAGNDNRSHSYAAQRR